jgi:hypothetical protein
LLIKFSSADFFDAWSKEFAWSKPSRRPTQATPKYIKIEHTILAPLFVGT